jgi:hypothetical protein
MSTHEGNGALSAAPAHGQLVEALVAGYEAGALADAGVALRKPGPRDELEGEQLIRAVPWRRVEALQPALYQPWQGRSSHVWGTP